MKSILRQLRQQIKAVPRKIWFLPLLLALCFLLLSLAIIALRYSELVQQIDEKLAFLALASVDTARSIISTLTGGLISLVVFSFSMVMVVLNQASAQFSPRLLPGLISQRQHQFILGFYLGAIIYNLTVLARIGPSDLEQSVPIISVLLAIVFGIVGLILFISFITTISNSVRIDTILHDLHASTQQKLQEYANNDVLTNQALPDDLEDWTPLNSASSGYLLQIETMDLLALCEKHKLKVNVLPYAGMFVLRGQEVLRVSKSVEEDLADDLLSCLLVKVQEDLQSDRLHGLKQVVEIAVKAMSPGINDPATAISGIDFLTSLLDTFLCNRPRNCAVDGNGGALVWLTARPLEEILFSLFSPLRTYCAGDVVVTRKIIYSLRQLQAIKTLSSTERLLFRQEVQKIKKDFLERSFNEADQGLISRL
ncbi:MAG: DUF2254 domain-containing protein [Lewinella sp.]|jgi:uncharacterized membrane protein|uniref:DUF2254 domain-containing protein n=1 Tax=Lewinella sp. TaxID=2004506 RepID=UPI003D6C0FBE